MFVIVGSVNPVKINATRIEFSEVFPNHKLKVVGIKVSSGISNQPIGIEKITKGAVNRAKNAMQKAKHEFSKELNIHTEIYSVGIEAGLVPVPSTISGYLDYQFCAIINSEGKISLSSGSGLDFPPKVVKILLEDPTMELGDIMGKLSGDKNIKYKDGAIGYYSNGRITRTDITRQGLQMALIPFINKNVFFDNKI